MFDPSAVQCAHGVCGVCVSVAGSLHAAAAAVDAASLVARRCVGLGVRTLHGPVYRLLSYSNSHPILSAYGFIL